MIRNVLTIAGSDCSGGAGIQADIKAISALGSYAMSVVTALTAQNTQGVYSVQLTSDDMVSDQLKSVIADVEIHAVKIGMLGACSIIERVAERLAPLSIPVVLDPVMVAKSGDKLLESDAVAALIEHLLPLATLITPNLPEIGVLLNEPEAKTRSDMERQAALLHERGVGAVLLKGGHLPLSESPDLLMTKDGTHWFDSPRIATQNTHGTGCTLSSALATCLAQGQPMVDAVNQSKRYVMGAIEHADSLGVGFGHGPTHHFWDLWTRQSS